MAVRLRVAGQAVSLERDGERIRVVGHDLEAERLAVLLSGHPDRLVELADVLQQYLDSHPELSLETAVTEIEELRRGAARGLEAVKALTHPVVLALLSYTRTEWLAATLLENPNTPLSVVERLLEEWPRMAETTLSSRPGLPIEMLRRYAGDGRVGYRKGVAMREGLPLELARILACDPDPLVRAAALRTQAGLTESDLEAALKDSHVEVRMALAQAEAITPRIQMMLATDPEEVVGWSLVMFGRLDPEAADYMAEHGAEKNREGMARYRELPEAVQVRLAQDPSMEVRRGLAGSSTLSPPTARRLAADAAPLVRVALAANTRLETPIRMLLTQDPEAEVRAALASRLELEPEIEMKLARDPIRKVKLALIERKKKGWELRRAALEVLACDRDGVVRKACAGLGWLPNPIQEQLARDTRKVVRQTMVRRQDLCQGAVLILAADPDFEIRQVVHRRWGQLLKKLADSPALG